ncbi:MAG TPA: NAD(P)H-dependent oxidoreductase subunit E [Clostridia bacterium]
MKFVLDEKKVALLKECIARHKQKPGPLMPSLHDAQKIFGCIPIEVQKIISEELNESVAKINGVVTFYSNFSTEPKGKHVISVCLGTACYVKGANEILQAIEEVLKIKPGETSEDGMFTLETTRCIGACGLAPVFKIDEKVYGAANKDIAKKAIEEALKA